MADDNDGDGLSWTIWAIWTGIELPGRLVRIAVIIAVTTALPVILVWALYEMVVAEPLIAGGTLLAVAVLAGSLTVALVWNNRAKKRRWVAPMCRAGCPWVARDRPADGPGDCIHLKWVLPDVLRLAHLRRSVDANVGTQRPSNEKSVP